MFKKLIYDKKVYNASVNGVMSTIRYRKWARRYVAAPIDPNSWNLLTRSVTLDYAYACVHQVWSVGSPNPNCS